MKWSKLKKNIEALLADSLRNRIKYHVTTYGPGESYIMTRGWMTFDGKEIANFSTIERLLQQSQLASEIERVNQFQDSNSSDQLAANFSPGEEVDNILDQKGVFSRSQFYQSLEEYVQLPIEAAITSTNPIIQAIAFLDRRFGSRRLEAWQMPVNANKLLKTCYRIRCKAEGIAAKF